jgi:hypothetical protein
MIPLSALSNMMVCASGAESSSIASRLSDFERAPVVNCTLRLGLGGEGRGRLIEEERGRLRSACEMSAQLGVGAGRGIEVGRGTGAGMGTGASKRWQSATRGTNTGACHSSSASWQ